MNREIKLLSVPDPLYPPMLKLTPNPPEKLFYKGNAGLLGMKTLTVVGTRSSTDYGRWAAYTIAKRVSEHGICVCSTLSEGIDTWALKGALAGGTLPVAVLASGLDICFPQNSKGLMKAVLENGLLLSEHEEGVPATKDTALSRNRLLTGLSSATVVVEAGFSSGALLTAGHAKDQGRNVYAVPGNINRVSSVGCNKLIQDGARPLVFLDDILKEFGIDPETGQYAL